METDHDIVIIGGGVIGVCLAYYLASKGMDVTLIEKGEIASGCSSGNGGLIVPSHSVPLASPGALGDGLRWLLDPESPFYIKPRLDVDLFKWLLRFVFARRLDAIRRSATCYLPGLADAKVLEIWRGLRPCTPDGLPIISRSKDFDNLIVAAGHAMLGMSLGPITGKLVSQMVGGDETEIDVSPFDACRF